MRHLVLVLGFLTPVCEARFAEAQDSLIPGSALNTTLPPSQAEVQGRFTGGLRTVTWWINSAVERRSQDAVRRILENQFAVHGDILNWAPAGYGALMSVTVIERSDPNSTLIARGILADNAQFVGYGTSPEAALFENIRSGSIGPSVPPGWSVVPTMSCYVWVHLDGERDLANRIVPQGTMLELMSRVRDNWPQMWRQQLENNLKKQDVWRTVAETAKQQIRDRRTRSTIDSTLKEVKRSQERVAEINTRLQKALEEAASASNAVTVLRALQGALTVADLARQASELLHENPTTFNSARSGTAVIQKAEQIRDNRQQYSVQLNARFEGSRDDLQRFLNNLWRQIQPANPPAVFGREFDVKLPPYVP